MAKETRQRLGAQDNPVTDKDKAELDIPEYVITAAKLNDGKVDFSFRIQKGVHEGDVNNTKGAGIFYDTLQDAFNKFVVHLTVIDQVFKHKGVEIDDIDTMHTDEEVLNYTVSSFKIIGENDSESIQIFGSKYTPLGDMPVQTPKIPLDGLSSYKWYNELKAASDEVRREVKLYKEGNFEVPEKEEPTSKQLKITDMEKANAFDDELEKASM